MDLLRLLLLPAMVNILVDDSLLSVFMCWPYCSSRPYCLPCGLPDVDHNAIRRPSFAGLPERCIGILKTYNTRSAGTGRARVVVQLKLKQVLTNRLEHARVRLNWKLHVFRI